MGDVWGSFLHGPPCPRASPGGTPGRPGSRKPRGVGVGGVAAPARPGPSVWLHRRVCPGCSGYAAPQFLLHMARPPTKPAPILRLAPTGNPWSPHGPVGQRPLQAGSQGVDGADEGCGPPSPLTKDALLQPLAASAAHATSMGQEPHSGSRARASHRLGASRRQGRPGLVHAVPVGGPKWSTE